MCSCRSKPCSCRRHPRRVPKAKVVKTPRPGGDRRGPQTQQVSSRRVPPGYTLVKRGRTTTRKDRVGGRHNITYNKGSTLIRKRKRKTYTKTAPKLGPSQWQIDHGFASGQMSQVAPPIQAQKQAILRSGGVPIWNDELNRWVTL